MTEYAESDQMRELLRKPFKEIGKLPRKTKTGKVIQLDYVGHAAVTDRLNAVSPDWTWNLDHVETYLDGDGLPHVAGIVGTLTVGGKSITEGGDPDKTSSYGEELKLAISDFIRRGAMRFGVALDLWSKEELEGRAPIGSSGGSASDQPPGAATADASTSSSAAPDTSVSKSGKVSEGKQGPSTASTPAHQHDWQPAPNPDAAKRGFHVCKSCGISQKDPK